MDSIKFYPNDYEMNGESLTEVVVTINGEPLLELIRQREQSFAAKDGQASIAGDYAYLSLIDFKKLFLDALSPNGRLAASGERSVVLLGCPCGIWGCWHLALKANLKRTRSDLATLRTRAAKIGGMSLSLNLTA